MKRLLILLTALSLLLPAAGCRKEAVDQNPPRTGVLTNVFRGTEYPLPQGWRLTETVPPVFDPEAGTVRCLASRRTETENEDGTITSDLALRFFLLSPDGVLEEEDAPTNPLCGTFVSDGFWCLAEDYETRSRRVLLKHGGETIADVTDSLDNGGRYVRELREDGEGFLILTEGAVAAFTKTGTLRFTVSGLGQFVSLLRDGDGALWAEGYFREGHGIVSVDPETCSTGAVLLLPSDVTGVSAGADGNLYAAARDGIVRLTLPEDGEAAGELVLSYLNSSIDGPNAALLAAADGDTFLLREYRKGEVTDEAVPVLCRRAEDIDLSTVTTLELAHAFPLDASLRTFIAAYNKSSGDCRIIVSDYSSRITDDDPLAGANQLAFEIAAGTARPDLVIGVPGAEDVGMLVRKSLFADLGPFMKKDDFLTPDNLFGAVKTAYASDGRLWGLPLSFHVSSLRSTKGILGSRASGKGWSVADLLDFAESLPDDVRLLNGLSREGAALSLLGPLRYQSFIDTKRAKCSFDSRDFIRWLNFLASLPSARDAHAMRDNEELYALYHAGKIALAEDHVYDLVNWFRREAIWGTDETVRIGYPSSSGDGAAVTSETVFLMTKFCSSPDAAWDFIRFCFRENEARSRLDIPMIPMIPALKSTFDKAVSGTIGAWAAIYYDGSLMTFDPGPGYPAAEDELEKPGILRIIDEEAVGRLKAELDLPGFPIGDALPSAVDEIIEEEISAFLAGATSAEDCAAKIQSRVSIWLAENK